MCARRPEQHGNVRSWDALLRHRTPACAIRDPASKNRAFSPLAGYDGGLACPALDFPHYTSRPTPASPHLWRCPMPVDPKSTRTEERKHLKVAVDLCSVDVRTPAHSGVTDNVSSHGARVLMSKPLKANERLNVRSMRGSYRSRARVVYCVPAEGGLFAVGLQLYAIAGRWVSPE